MTTAMQSLLLPDGATDANRHLLGRLLAAGRGDLTHTEMCRLCGDAAAWLVGAAFRVEVGEQRCASLRDEVDAFEDAADMLEEG